MRVSFCCSSRTIKFNVIPMGILMGAYSLCDNFAPRDDSADSQPDSGSRCISDSKEGLHQQIALIFTRHFWLKGIATIQYLMRISIISAAAISFYLNENRLLHFNLTIHALIILYAPVIIVPKNPMPLLISNYLAIVNQLS